MKARSSVKRIAVFTVVLALLGCGVVLAQRPHTQPRMLVGHVFGGHDEPVEKAIVYLKNTKTLMIRTYISDADGSYRFPALSPNVDYEVYAESNGSRSDTKTVSAFDDRKLLDITLRLKK
jgi:hypothetical protein